MQPKIKYVWVFLVSGFVLTIGCSQNKRPGMEAFIEPPPSQLLQAEIAGGLRRHLPAGADAQDQGGKTEKEYNSDKPGSFKFEVKWEYHLREGKLDEYQEAGKKYLADVAAKCRELGGTFTENPGEKGASGFVVSASYSLPKRTGKLTVTASPFLDRPKHPVTILVHFTEYAEGEEKPK